MPILQFVSACLLIGIGLVIAAEALLHVRVRVIPPAAANMIVGLGGLTTAILGGYWAASAVPW